MNWLTNPEVPTDWLGAILLLLGFGVFCFILVALATSAQGMTLIG